MMHINEDDVQQGTQNATNKTRNHRDPRPVVPDTRD